MVVPEEAMRFTFVRSSGPGGQNVNKLSTKAQLRVAMSVMTSVIGAEAASRLRSQAAGRINDADELMLSADDSRSQRCNRDACVEQLRVLVLRALVRPKTRRATRPSAGSKRRRRATKEHRAATKRDRREPRGES